MILKWLRANKTRKINERENLRFDWLGERKKKARVWFNERAKYTWRKWKNKFSTTFRTFLLER